MWCSANLFYFDDTLTVKLLSEPNCQYRNMQIKIDNNEWVNIGPTDAPTSVPTQPTDAPTNVPSDVPTDAPSDGPSDTPTNAPTDEPTDGPTGMWTSFPDSETTIYTFNSSTAYSLRFQFQTSSSALPANTPLKIIPV